MINSSSMLLKGYFLESVIYNEDGLNPSCVNPFLFRFAV